MFFGNYNKPGRGISKEEINNKSGVALYFDILPRRIWKMMTLNLLYVLVSIPAILISIVISFYLLVITASYKGIDFTGSTTPFLYLSVMCGIAFFQMTGSGPATVAKNYVLRKYVNDRHSWVVSDFFENIKKNFKQGMVVYIINIVLLSALLFASISYFFIFKNSILTMLVIAFMIAFVMMQLYVYQLVACVELKIKHIYKNALSLTIIKLPWNILVSLVTVLMVCSMYYLALSVPIVVVALIFAIYFVIISFTQIFMTNNIVKKYIIEPSECRI